MLTGEPGPVSKGPGDKVIGATMNTSGALVIRAEKVGSATVLSQIVQLVAQAQRSRAPMQRMADLVAGYFVMAVVDRKSTRLNSSHVAISYAVFCLKKKNKMTSS